MRWAEARLRAGSIAPTPEGVAVIGLALVLCGAGSWLGQVGVLAAGGLIAGTVVGGEVLATLGFRGLRVGRTLPDDPVAGPSAWGVWRVSAGAWPVPAFRVSEADGRAPSEVAAMSAGEQRAAPARWRWRVRGHHRLGGISVASVGWFGVVRRRFWLDDVADLVVGVAPREGPVVVDPSPGGEHAGSEGVDPEFASVRPWREGEPWRQVHAARSARAGRPIVVTRRAASADAVVLRVRDDDAVTFEADLSAVAFRIRSQADGAFIVRRGNVSVVVSTAPMARRRALDALALWDAP